MPELDGAGGVHPEPDGDDGVKIVVLDLPGDFTRAFPSNHPEFPDSCLPALLALPVNIAQVLIEISGPVLAWWT